MQQQLQGTITAIAAQALTLCNATQTEIKREQFIQKARNGLDNGMWAFHVTDTALHLQTINAIVRRSNLAPEIRLEALRQALDIAINDAADCAIQ